MMSILDLHQTHVRGGSVEVLIDLDGADLLVTLPEETQDAVEAVIHKGDVYVPVKKFRRIFEVLQPHLRALELGQEPDESNVLHLQSAHLITRILTDTAVKLVKATIQDLKSTVNQYALNV